MALTRHLGNSEYLGPALAAIVLALAFAALPATAAAGRHPSSPLSAAFTVRSTNGFSIDVESEDGRVAVVASERGPPIATFSPAGTLRPAGRANGASSIYYARGATADPATVDARLGALGRIAVSFHPSGEVRVTELRPGAGGCGGGARLVRRLGTFSGVVDFRGEDGYTSVRARSARGSVGTSLPHCPAATAEPHAAAAERRPWPQPGSAVLTAVDRGARTSFKATTTDTGVAFLAVLRERQPDGLLVARRAYAGAPPSAFAFDRALSSARVRPPAPFAGSARFEQEPGGGAWTGNLVATFPGATLPLTGQGFEAKLGAGR